MPKFQCIHCGQKIEAEAEFSGKEASCPICHSSVVVPLLTRQEGSPRGSASVLSTFVEPTDPVTAPFAEPPPPPPPMPEPEPEPELQTKPPPRTPPPLPPRQPSPSSPPASPSMRAPSGVPMHHVSYREDEMDVPEVRGSRGKRARASRGRVWQPMVAVGVAAVVAFFVWQWLRAPQKGKGDSGDSLTLDSAGDSSAKADSNVPGPPRHMTLQQWSERDLVSMGGVMKLSNDDQKWLGATWGNAFVEMHEAIAQSVTRLGAEGGDQLLQPERVAADQDFRDSYVMLEKMDERDRDLAAQISGLTQQFKDEVTGRFSMTAAELAAQYNPGQSISYIVAQLRAASRQQRRLIDYLRHNQKKWQMREGRFDFATAELDGKYMDLLDELAAIHQSINRLDDSRSSAPSLTRSDVLVPPDTLSILGRSRRELGAMQSALKLPEDKAQALDETWLNSEKLLREAVNAGLDQFDAQELRDLFNPQRVMADQDFARSYAILNDIDWRDRAILQKIKDLGANFKDIVASRLTNLPSTEWERYNPSNPQVLYMQAMVDENKKNREIINHLKSCRSRLELRDQKIHYQKPTDQQRYHQLLGEWDQINWRILRLAPQRSQPPSKTPPATAPAAVAATLPGAPPPASSPDFEAQRKMLAPRGYPEPIFRQLNLSPEDRSRLDAAWRTYQQTGCNILDNARRQEKHALYRLFEPTRASNDEGYLESASKLKDLRTIWLTAESETRRLVDSTKQSLDSAKLDSRLIFRGFTHEEILGEFYRLQRARSDKVEEIFRFLRAHPWKPLGSHFVFANAKEDAQLTELFRDYAMLEKRLQQQGM